MRRDLVNVAREKSTAELRFFVPISPGVLISPYTQWCLTARRGFACKLEIRSAGCAYIGPVEFSSCFITPPRVSLCVRVCLFYAVLILAPDIRG